MTTLEQTLLARAHVNSEKRAYAVHYAGHLVCGVPAPSELAYGRSSAERRKVRRTLDALLGKELT